MTLNSEPVEVGMQSLLEDMNSPYSPSFNSLFNADVVARVTSEILAADDDGFFPNDVHYNGIRYENREDCSETEDEDAFEFNLSDLVPADGDFRPVYPVFDRDLLLDFDLVGEIESPPSNHEEESTRAQIQLKNLFLEDRGGEPPSSSSSSSEADELDQIPPGTYCVWTPNKSPLASPSQGRCTKSSSTGSSKAWKLRDLLLKRSKSDGKNGSRLMMILTPKKKAEKQAPALAIRGSATASGGGGAGAGRKAVRDTAAACGRYYVYGGGEKNKRRSYLPYQQDLVAGFFVSRHAFRKLPLPIFG